MKRLTQNEVNTLLKKVDNVIAEIKPLEPEQAKTKVANLKDYLLNVLSNEKELIQIIGITYQNQTDLVEYLTKKNGENTPDIPDGKEKSLIQNMQKEEIKKPLSDYLSYVRKYIIDHFKTV